MAIEIDGKQKIGDISHFNKGHEIYADQKVQLEAAFANMPEGAGGSMSNKEVMSLLNGLIDLSIKTHGHSEIQPSIIHDFCQIFLFATLNDRHDLLNALLQTIMMLGEAIKKEEGVDGAKSSIIKL